MRRKPLKEGTYLCKGCMRIIPYKPDYYHGTPVCRKCVPILADMDDFLARELVGPHTSVVRSEYRRVRELSKVANTT